MATVGSLAALVNGSVVGNPDIEIRGVADLASAGPQHISFVANPKYEKHAAATKAAAILVGARIEQGPAAQIVCDDPYLAMAHVATALHPPRQAPAGAHDSASVHPKAQVHPSASVAAQAVVDAGAKIGARASIGAGCYVGVDATVGEEAILHPGARLLDGCEMGHRSILQAGAVIGSDGFGYAQQADGRRKKIPQMGVVELGQDVEVGANSTIDRATFGVTRIGDGTKIDNLVQIAHNVELGQHCVVVSQCGVAGTTRIGDRVVMGAQTGVAGHIEIVSDVMLGARSGVTKSVPQAGIYSGFPILPHHKALKVTMAQQHTPDLRRRTRLIEKQLAKLEQAKQGK